MPLIIKKSRDKRGIVNYLDSFFILKCFKQHLKKSKTIFYFSYSYVNCIETVKKFSTPYFY